MLSVRLELVGDVSRTRRNFAETARGKLETVVNDRRFMTRVREARYTGRRLRDDAGNLVDADNGTIARIVEQGKERRTTPDEIIQLRATFARLSRRRTIGFVSPPSPLITTNTSFVEDWEADGEHLSLASHWMHEWMHVAGFRHKRADRTDVPYSLGDIVADLGEAQAIEEGLDAQLAAALAAGYREASKPDNDSCPVYENCVREDYIDGAV